MTDAPMPLPPDAHPDTPPARRRFVLARLATAVRRQDWFTVLVEIAVVVLGVVIGFQVNAWGQDRSDRAEEHALLVGLRADMETNLARIDTLVAFNEQSIRHARALLAVTGPSPTTIAPEVTDSLLLRTLEWEVYSPAEGRLDALLASGRIGLIQSDSLQAALADWQSVVRSMRENERVTSDLVHDHFLPYLRTRVPLLSMDASTGVLTTGPSQFPQDYGRVLQDVQFENLVEDRWINTQFVLSGLVSVRSETLEILRLIDARLGE